MSWFFLPEISTYVHIYIPGTSYDYVALTCVLVIIKKKTKKKKDYDKKAHDCSFIDSIVDERDSGSTRVRQEARGHGYSRHGVFIFVWPVSGTNSARDDLSVAVVHFRRTAVAHFRLPNTVSLGRSDSRLCAAATNATYPRLVVYFLSEHAFISGIPGGGR